MKEAEARKAKREADAARAEAARRPKTAVAIDLAACPPEIAAAIMKVRSEVRGREKTQGGSKGSSVLGRAAAMVGPLPGTLPPSSGMTEGDVGGGGSRVAPNARNK